MTYERLTGYRRTELRRTVGEEGRVCRSADCDTILSRYNSSEFCAVCDAGPTARAKRVRRANAIAAASELEPADPEGHRATH